MKIPKIDLPQFGPLWIILSLAVGGVVPAVIWLLIHVFVWWLMVVGGVSLLIFLIVFAVEMKRDLGKVPYYQKHLKDTIPFDPETQYAVIRSSICTGEKVAGFRDRKGSGFTEVMLIKSESDKKRFMSVYGLEKVDTEY